MKIKHVLKSFKLRVSGWDINSLRFKLWAYFVLFAISLMAALWLFQTIFLQPYYQEMKKKDILRTAHTITSKYSQAYDSKDDEYITEMANIIADAAYKNDMYISLQIDGMIITPLTGNSGGPPRFFVGNQLDFRVLERQLEQSPTGTISLLQKSRNGKNNTMLFAQLIEKNEHRAMLCISAPLTPLESTISILASQLVIVTIASLLLACALSIWISRRVTAPILQITRKAGDLARGHYGIAFDGGHYSEIQDLANTLTHTSNELAKADNLQRDLIANVSHDLRTPLTMVKSYAEMIRDISGDQPEKRNSHLQVIIDEADRLNLLVNDLLLLSKMQSGVETMQCCRFDLMETISALLKTYSILEEQDGYHFRFFVNGEERFLKESIPDNGGSTIHDNPPIIFTESPFMVQGDENRLKQVISNLLNNAIRHGGDSTEINILLNTLNDEQGFRPSKPAKQNKKTTTPAFNYIRVSVLDHGPGISPEELEHIWDRYYKVSSTGARVTSGGSGLGLSIVKEILLLHHARFGVDSIVGKGSTFWFELPTIA